MPYSRITALVHEERVISHGSKPLGILGIMLLLFGLGAPTVGSNLLSLLLIPGSRIAGLTGSFSLPSIAMLFVGVGLIASKFPRRAREGWWQVKGQDMSAEDQRGWQIAGKAKGTEELVRAIKEGISSSTQPKQGRSQ